MSVEQYWTAPLLLTTLRTQLMARAGLTGVTISTAPQGDKTPPEAIEFVDVTGSQEFAALGNKGRDDTYTVTGWIWINKPGASEVVAQAARDRAAELLAELAAELKTDPSVGGVVRVAGLGSISMDQGINTKGRWCQIDFEISVTTRL